MSQKVPRIILISNLGSALVGAFFWDTNTFSFNFGQSYFISQPYISQNPVWPLSRGTRCGTGVSGLHPGQAGPDHGQALVIPEGDDSHREGHGEPPGDAGLPPGHAGQDFGQSSFFPEEDARPREGRGEPGREAPPHHLRGGARAPLCRVAHAGHYCTQTMQLIEIC